MERCPWAGETPIYQRYHDTEWGVPVTDDRDLFAKLILDGFQAGLSWLTILKKRENFYTAFDGFDPERIAVYDDAKIAALMADTGIVRNRAKITATIGNARGWLHIQEKGPGFADFLWRYVDYRPVQNNYTAMSEVPAETPLSRRISKDLRKQGFRFVGPTIVYAFMQAVGMVNDHLRHCHRHGPVAAMADDPDLFSGRPPHQG